jgi:hypothetical protein
MKPKYVCSIAINLNLVVVLLTTLGGTVLYKWKEKNDMAKFCDEESVVGGTRPQEESGESDLGGAYK